MQQGITNTSQFSIMFSDRLLGREKDINFAVVIL